jgi:hypothetical protein
MKTYAETQGQESFDWNKFLENPPKKGSPEHLDACDLAEAWITCACGNLCDIIPRCPLRGRPIDDYLERLGISFNNNIQDARYDCAKEILAGIENRSAEIIFELTK